MARRAHGEGDVGLYPGSKGPNTKYRARKWIKLPDGTRKRVEKYGPNRKAALLARDKAIQELMQNVPTATTTTFYQTVAEMFTAKERTWKRSTLNTYAQQTRLHILPVLKDKPITEIEVDDIKDIQDRLVDEGKHRTAQITRTVLSHTFQFAIKRYRREIKAGEIYLYDLTQDLEKVVTPPKIDLKDKVWTPEQLERFLAYAEEQYVNSRSLYYPLYYTAIAAGLRRGELMALRWPNVIEEHRGMKKVTYIRVVEQYVSHNNTLYKDTPKTASGVRDVPIDESLYEFLLEHKARLEKFTVGQFGWNKEQLVFPTEAGTPIDPNNLRRGFKTIIGACELPDIKFHTLRKTFATYLARNLIGSGKNAPKVLQKLLGHSKPDVAMSIYAQVLDEDLEGSTFNPRAKRVTDGVTKEVDNDSGINKRAT